jgi:hypothetical protein
VPIAGDQAARIARCVEAGGVEAPAPDEVVARCAALLGDGSSGASPGGASLGALAAAARAAGVTDALPGMVSRIGEHLGLA